MDEQWIGYRNGIAVAAYPNRFKADLALERREVEAVAPAKQGA